MRCGKRTRERERQRRWSECERESNFKDLCTHITNELFFYLFEMAEKRRQVIFVTKSKCSGFSSSSSRCCYFVFCARQFSFLDRDSGAKQQQRDNKKQSNWLTVEWNVFFFSFMNSSAIRHVGIVVSSCWMLVNKRITPTIITLIMSLSK